MSAKLIFKMDGIGASISLLLTLVLLLPLNHVFGFAPLYLGCLIIFASLLMAYNLFCWRTADVQWKPKMKGLIALNSPFMLIGITVLLHPAFRPNILGVLYLLGELVIIFVLITIQFRSLKEKQP